MQTENSRNPVNLQWLKGLCIAVMILKHGGGGLNHLGARSDLVTTMLHYLTTPIGTQLFLALACFGLTKRTPLQIRAALRFRLRAYAVIAFLSILECAVLSRYIAHPLSLFPVLDWMILLALNTVVYAFAGVRGICGLVAAQLLLFALPMDLWTAEVQSVVQTVPGFSRWLIDAPLHYYLGTSALGVLMGYTYFHLPWIKTRSFWLYGSSVGLVGYAIWLTYSGYGVDGASLYASEYGAAQSLTGMLAVWGMLFATIGIALWLEWHRVRFGSGRWGQWVHWLGRNAFFVFLLHRLIFMHVWLPVRIFVSQQGGWPLTNTVWDMATVLLLTVVLCRALFAWSGAVFYGVVTPRN